MPPSRDLCAAHRQNGDQCTKLALEGMTVCRHHGGASPQAIAGAQTRIFEGKARDILFDYHEDRRRIVNPFEELLDLASEIVAFKDAVHVLVQDLLGRITQDIGGANNSALEETLRPQIAVYERALDRCAAILAKIVQLGIEDRMARVTEQQASLFARLIDGIVTDLGHNPTDPVIAAAITRRLQLAIG